MICKLFAQVQECQMIASVEVRRISFRTSFGTHRVKYLHLWFIAVECKPYLLIEWPSFDYRKAMAHNLVFVMHLFSSLRYLAFVVSGEQDADTLAITRTSA